MFGNKNVRNISDMIDLAKFEQQWSKPEDFPGQTLILLDANKRSGTRGDYYVIKVMSEELGVELFISTGATQPTMVIRAWQDLGSPPMRFQFVKDGQRIMMNNAPD